MTLAHRAHKLVSPATQAFPVPAAAQEFYGDDYYGRPRFRKFLEYFDVPGTILDYGCNEGVFLNLLRSAGREGLGIDYDLDLIEVCRGHGLEAMHADIFEFSSAPENRNRYAGVMLADFVEHFDPYPLQQLLRQTVGVLKPGAPIVIVTPNSHSIHMNAGGFYETTIEHHNPYSVNGLRIFLEKEGMEFVAGGYDPDSKVPIFSWHPARLARNLAIWTLGRILCGSGCMYECTYLVMKKGAEETTTPFAQRPASLELP